MARELVSRLRPPVSELQKKPARAGLGAGSELAEAPGFSAGRSLARSGRFDERPLGVMLGYDPGSWSGSRLCRPAFCIPKATEFKSDTPMRRPRHQPGVQAATMAFGEVGRRRELLPGFRSKAGCLDRLMDDGPSSGTCHGATSAADARDLSRVLQATSTRSRRVLAEVVSASRSSSKRHSEPPHWPA